LGSRYSAHHRSWRNHLPSCFDPVVKLPDRSSPKFQEILAPHREGDKNSGSSGVGPRHDKRSHDPQSFHFCLQYSQNGILNRIHRPTVTCQSTVLQRPLMLRIICFRDSSKYLFLKENVSPNRHADLFAPSDAHRAGRCRSSPAVTHGRAQMR